MIHIIDNITAKHDVWPSEILLNYKYTSSNIKVLEGFFSNPKFKNIIGVADK